MRSARVPPTTKPGYVSRPDTRAEWMLHVISPRELCGLTLPLEPGAVLGRTGPHAIDHETVSRQHATVVATAGGVGLQDMGSRNGTRLNGKFVSAAVTIGNQDIVRLGDVLLVVDVAAADVESWQQPLLGALPGRSQLVDRVRQQLFRALSDTAPVLVLGETGTGKERVAQAVHHLSGRQGPFVAVNCAGLSAQLFESELFGHERGAFTGAQAAKPGLFRAAQSGTIFLDEIGEIALDSQAKLLRTLQEHEVRPVGAVHAIPVNVRVVAATNADLGRRVESGEFRRDLLARLAFWELELPPLRLRKIDVLDWIRYFQGTQSNTQPSAVAPSFTPDATELLLVHDWPDNLRGLQRVVHRLAAFATASPIEKKLLLDVCPELGPARPVPPLETCMVDALPSLPRTLLSKAPGAEERPTPDELKRVFEATSGNVRATAKHFGKDRRQIYRWLKQMGIERQEKS